MSTSPAPTTRTKVLLVDDHAPVLRCLAGQYQHWTGRLQIAGQAVTRKLPLDHYRTVQMVKDRLQAVPAVIHLPVGSGGPESAKPFAGLVDLVKMKALIWRDEELGAKWDELEIPADMADQAAEYRELLLETIAGSDDQTFNALMATVEEGVAEYVKWLAR